MQYLKQVHITNAEKAKLEPEGDEMNLTGGRTAQSFRPPGQDDERLFERITWPDGSVQWFQLVEK